MKTKYKCTVYIKIKEDKIIASNNIHNHPNHRMDIMKEQAKKDIKRIIKNALDPFSINLQKTVKTYSADKGIRCPAFKTIKNCLYKELNKNIPDDILDLSLAPENSLYYKTLNNENFVIYKDKELMILQSPGLAKIQLKLGNIDFCDGTFFICPSVAYQVFITRVYSSITHSYYTTSFSIMKNKSEKDYTKVFNVLNENIKKYLDIGESYEIEEVHTDFELAIGKGCKNIYPDVSIKFCIWHFLRALEINKNKICSKEIKENDVLYKLIKTVSNLYICDPDYVLPIFELICKKNTNNNFKNFLTYFKNQYILKIDIHSWNYYKNFTHITNNSCESYNCKLNKIFKVKPTFFKLLYELRIEEQDIVTTYEKRKAGLLGHEIRRNLNIINKKNY